jgi:biopolymer transport protein ExbB/TolQ
MESLNSFIEKDFNKKDITFTKIALAIAVTSVMVAVALAPTVLSQALILMLLFLSGTHSKDIQTDEELKERIVSRQEEKGKGDLSAASEQKEGGGVTDSKLLDSQQAKRTKRNGKKHSISKQKEQQQPNMYELSKQLENHTKQLSTITSIVQQLPKFLKNADMHSIKQINSSMNKLQ